MASSCPGSIRWLLLLLVWAAAPSAQADLVAPQQINLTQLVEIALADPDGYSGFGDPMPERAASPNARPFKIYFDYQLKDTTPDSDAQYLKTQLMPSIAKAFAPFLSVKSPVQGNLKVTPWCTDVTASGQCVSVVRTCGNIQGADGGVLKEKYLERTPANANPLIGPGVKGGPGVDGDIVIMVTNDPCPDRVLAYAGPCAQDTTTFRPTAALINWCFYPNSNFQSDLVIAVHELTHALGFTPFLWQTNFGFIRPDGTPYSPLQVFQRNGRNVAHITSPKVLAATKAKFGCSQIKGAPLEDSGGPLTSGAHWEQQLFLGEAMAGVATGFNRFDVPAYSPITLSLLADSGWYNVNFQKAGFDSWGFKGGCEFALTDAKVLKTSTTPTITRHFCPKVSSEKLCTHDYTAIGTCSTINISVQKASGAVSVNTLNGLKYVKVGSDSDCLSPTLQPSFGKGGPTSRCIPDSTSALGVSCRQMKCVNGNLLVNASGTFVRCPTGKTVSAGNDFPGKTIGPCPDNHVLCSQPVGKQPGFDFLSCPTACSLHGDCLRGKCYCYVGWKGADCSIPTV